MWVFYFPWSLLEYCMFSLRNLGGDKWGEEVIKFRKTFSWSTVYYYLNSVKPYWLLHLWCLIIFGRLAGLTVSKSTQVFKQLEYNFWKRWSDNLSCMIALWYLMVRILTKILQESLYLLQFVTVVPCTWHPRTGSNSVVPLPCKSQKKHFKKKKVVKIAFNFHLFF